MAYVNTGYARNKTLTITKGNYSHDYDLCAGFNAVGKPTVYPSLSDEGFARLSDADYQARLADFIEYVCSLESGLATDCPNMDIGSVIYDTDSCPLPSAQREEEEENE